MAAVANGTGLDCPDDGLAFPPTGLHDLAGVFRPVADGGRLPRSGSRRYRCQPGAGRPRSLQQHPLRRVRHLQGHNEYTRACFKQYGLLDRPVRLVRLDVAPLPHDRAGNQRQRAVGGPARASRPGRRRSSAATPLPRPSGTSRLARCWTARAATPFGQMRSRRPKSLAAGALPIGLAHNVSLSARSRRIRWYPSTMSNWIATSTWSSCGARWSDVGRRRWSRRHERPGAGGSVRHVA